MYCYVYIHTNKRTNANGSLSTHVRRGNLWKHTQRHIHGDQVQTAKEAFGSRLPRYIPWFFFLFLAFFATNNMTNNTDLNVYLRCLFTIFKHPLSLAIFTYFPRRIFISSFLHFFTSFLFHFSLQLEKIFSLRFNNAAAANFISIYYSAPYKRARTNAHTASATTAPVVFGVHSFFGDAALRSQTTTNCTAAQNKNK